VQPGDPQRGLANPGPQFRRIDEFGFGAEREHVGHRLLGRFDWYPGLHPAVAMRGGRRAPADLHPGRPAEQHGQASAARRQPDRRASAASGRGGGWAVMQPA